MRWFGLGAKKAKVEKALSQPTSRGGWLPVIRESYAGAWQQNVTVDRDTALTYFAVFSCMTLIASDVAKLGLRLLTLDQNGIWVEATSPAHSPVLRKPNSIQNRIQFWDHYMLSKLSAGNVYVLKGRDNRNVVTSLHILDPHRVQPLVSPQGEVFYRLSTDNMAGIEDETTVPASEIIHDRMNTLYHPLVGLSPLAAAGVAAMQGATIQSDSTNFFANRGVPGGVLSAPGAISDETATRLKTYWETEFKGENAGRIAVLGDGLAFVPMRATAVDSQLVEQLKWTADIVCSVFHVPPYKIGIGEMPKYDNIQSLNTEYYSQALQSLIEAAELALDEGLNLPEGTRTQFNIDDLLRMDSVSQMEFLKQGVGAGIMAPNEGRKRVGLGPVAGGDSPYLQEQNYSLEALSKRDALPPATPAKQRKATRKRTAKKAPAKQTRKVKK